MSSRSPRRNRIASASSSQLPAAPLPRRAQTSQRVRATPSGAPLSSLEITRFWGEYLDDPPLLLGTPRFRRFVWLGVPDEWDLRRQVWPSFSPRVLYHRRSPLPPPPTVDPLLSEQVQAQLQDSRLGAEADRALVERLVAATAQRLGELTPGSAPLAAVLLQVCDGDEGEAAALLCTVLEVAEERVGEGRALLRTDCLLVADLVAAEMKDVADHFNRVGFDAVDLADIVCIWVGSVFAAQFPSEFVLRALDVMFTEENMVFAVIVFAIIAVHKEELLRAQEADKLYNYFYAIPELLQTQKIEKVFRVAYETLIGFPDLEQKRDQKDWEWTIRRPGVPGFTPGVGNYSEEEGDGEKVDDKLGSLKSAANSFILSPDTVPEEGDDLEEEEDMEGGPDIGDDIPEIEDKDFENPKELREKMKKVMDGVNFLRRKDDRARKVIRDLQQKIRLMEDDLSRLNHSPRSSTGGSFGAAGADLGNLVANLRKVEDTGIQGLGMPAPKTAEDDYKYQSFKLDDLNISYSSIYDQIEFPCPYMEGYLFKLSKAGIFSKPNLQRKWFVMKGRFLTYFKNHEHTRPQKDRCIDLKGCQIATLKRHPKGEFGIEISNSLYKFLIFAPDQTEFLKWVVALKAAASS